MALEVLLLVLDLKLEEVLVAQWLSLLMKAINLQLKAFVLLGEAPGQAWLANGISSTVMLLAWNDKQLLINSQRFLKISI